MASRYFRRKRGPGAPKRKSDAPFSEDIQQQLTAFLGDELQVAKRNTESAEKDFAEYYDMIHCLRKNKQNEWESDIFLPEFVSRLLTQIGNFVQQYFSSTDFVDTVETSEDPYDIAEAKASKRLLNTLLNDKKAHYFAKLVRLLMFVFPSGRGYIKGCYRQQTRQRFKGYRTESNYVQNEMGEILAEDGSVYADSLRQTPMSQSQEIPIYDNEIIEDRPDFDIYPNQYVHVSPEYTYSLQDKRYIIFESELTVDELYSRQQTDGYFNLHMLENMRGDQAVKEYADKTYNKNNDLELPPKPISEPFVIYERWGKFPCIVERDENGMITSVKPGINKNGEYEDNVENIECIISWAAASGASPKKSGNDIPQPGDILIRFQNSPYSRRPTVRFQCYIDALKDNGFGDGEVNRELQLATNDMYNLSNYRTQLATTPAFKGRRFSGLPAQIKIDPERVIELENIEDLQEILIKDDIQGAMAHIGMLSSRMDYAMATSPVTMGMEPSRRETATMGAIMDRRASVRIGMKSMTLEFVGFVEFYDMLLSLCNDFMMPDTLNKLIGEEDARAYNPDREDRFKPVTQAIETEESKQFKIKMWDQILGRVVSIPNPKTPLAVNYILGQVLELMGGDFKHFKKFMFSEDPKANMLYMLATGGGQGQGSTPNAFGAPGMVSNQAQLPMTGQETGVREAATA